MSGDEGGDGTSYTSCSSPEQRSESRGSSVSAGLREEYEDLLKYAVVAPKLLDGSTTLPPTLPPTTESEARCCVLCVYVCLIDIPLAAAYVSEDCWKDNLAHCIGSMEIHTYIVGDFLCLDEACH